MIDEDYCISCDQPAVVQYRHKDIKVGVCGRHWAMHCHSLVPYNLKKEIEPYVESEEE